MSRLSVRSALPGKLEVALDGVAIAGDVPRIALDGALPMSSMAAQLCAAIEDVLPETKSFGAGKVDPRLRGLVAQRGVIIAVRNSDAGAAESVPTLFTSMVSAVVAESVIHPDVKRNVLLVLEGWTDVHVTSPALGLSTIVAPFPGHIGSSPTASEAASALLAEVEATGSDARSSLLATAVSGNASLAQLLTRIAKGEPVAVEAPMPAPAPAPTMPSGPQPATKATAPKSSWADDVEDETSQLPGIGSGPTVTTEVPAPRPVAVLGADGVAIVPDAASPATADTAASTSNATAMAGAVATPLEPPDPELAAAKAASVEEDSWVTVDHKRRKNRSAASAGAAGAETSASGASAVAPADRRGGYDERRGAGRGTPESGGRRDGRDGAPRSGKRVRGEHAPMACPLIQRTRFPITPQAAEAPIAAMAPAATVMAAMPTAGAARTSPAGSTRLARLGRDEATSRRLLRPLDPCPTIWALLKTA